MKLILRRVRDGPPKLSPSLPLVGLVSASSSRGFRLVRAQNWIHTKGPEACDIIPAMRKTYYLNRGFGFLGVGQRGLVSVWRKSCLKR